MRIRYEPPPAKSPAKQRLVDLHAEALERQAEAEEARRKAEATAKGARTKAERAAFSLTGQPWEQKRRALVRSDAAVEWAAEAAALGRYPDPEKALEDLTEFLNQYEPNL